MPSEITIYSVYEVFTRPSLVKYFNNTQWQSFIRVVRGADLLASFYYLLERSNLIQYVPNFWLKHLTSAKTYADRQAHQVVNECKLLESVLSQIRVKPIFLKGAAYVLRQDTNHYGRVMSDIDILVNKSELQMVEECLKRNDWVEKELDIYDQQYYRKWAHELPPFIHKFKGTTLDIHFTLIPPITGIVLEEKALFENAQLTSSNLYVLHHNLLVLHCMIHLFYNEDFSKSFRDILDIHVLVEELDTQSGLEELSCLAKTMGFYREFFYAISVKDKIFNTNKVSMYNLKPPSFTYSNRYFVNNILYRGMMPSHELIFNRWNSFAQFILFIRGHILKMPLKVLIPHLFTKAKRRLITSIMGAHHYEK
ncbi:MAG: nucleotidyltransferase family protein [Paraglaciecola sp.]|uniref:nucleotidyltransferase family protein n=1 Tax=Paraglaciecola sp. TaxID=1920173 RepID=UPI00329871FB